jgi:hypothetical protein
VARRLSRAGERAQRRQIILGMLILVGVGLVLGAIAYWWVNREHPLTASLCPSNGPTGHVVLLVDKTDPLTFVQREAFDTFLINFVERGVAPGHLVSVFALGEAYQETAKPVFELCNPGTGADKSEWTTSIKKLIEQYESRFYRPMLELATQLQTVTPGKTSPIFEMLQLVSVNAIKKHTTINGDRRLIIVSDMMHNTSEYSMYVTPPDYMAFAHTAYGRQTHVDLAGVNVEIQYLVNAPILQTRRHITFWEQYFNNTGGRLTTVQPF